MLDLFEIRVTPLSFKKKWTISRFPKLVQAHSSKKTLFKSLDIAPVLHINFNTIVRMKYFSKIAFSLFFIGYWYTVLLYTLSGIFIEVVQ